VELPESADTVVDGLLLNLLANLTDFLMANVTAFNISSAWASDNPSSDPISLISNTTYPLLICKEQIKLGRDPFYANYAAAHDGRRPFVNPNPLFRWSCGDNSTATIEEAVANKTQFMDWFNSEALAPDPEACSNSILLYVGSDASTVYRNTYGSPPRIPFGFSAAGYRCSVRHRTLCSPSKLPSYHLPLLGL
jgi:hypothetical protein